MTEAYDAIVAGAGVLGAATALARAARPQQLFGAAMSGQRAIGQFAR